MLLAADNNIRLEAAQNTAEQHSSSKGSSWALGVAASYGSDGGAIGVTASASASRGNADGKDVTQRNTHVTAGNTATVISGGDTTLKGAQLSADKVVANVGGDLNIESLQDTSTYGSKNKSMGASVTVGAGFSGSASYSSSKVDGDYASVTEQSGIQAGAGGFDITVAGNTDLKGAVIASSQEAIDASLNRLQTGTLTSSDIENHSQYNAKSVSLSGGYSVAGEGGATEGSQSTTNNGSNWSWQNFNTGAQGASAGYGSEKGKENSTTSSGISGGTVVIADQSGHQALTGKTAEEMLAALNRDVLTGDDANGLAKAWDGQKLQQQVEAQAQITAMFGQQASKAVGDYAQKQMELAAESRKKAADATDPAEKESLNALADQLSSQWGESGSLRVLAHTVIGGLTGGVGGAAGAAAGTLTAPKVAEALHEAGVTGPLADVLTGVASTAVGAAAGGTAGGAAGLNEVANNWLSHKQIADANLELAGCEVAGGNVRACKDAVIAKTDALDVSQQENWRAYQERVEQELVAEQLGGAWYSKEEYMSKAAELSAIYWNGSGETEGSAVFTGYEPARGAGYVMRSILGSANDYVGFFSRPGFLVLRDMAGGAILGVKNLATSTVDYLKSPLPAANLSASIDNKFTLTTREGAEIVVGVAIGVASDGLISGLSKADVTPVGPKGEILPHLHPDAIIGDGLIDHPVKNIDELWKLSPTLRGSTIESILSKTDYKDWYNIGQSQRGKFPLIDFQKGDNLVSLKTIDTRGSSWVYDMRNHIQELSQATATVDGRKAIMILDIRTQPGGAALAQSLVKFGSDRGIIVNIGDFDGR